MLTGSYASFGPNVFVASFYADGEHRFSSTFPDEFQALGTAMAVDGSGAIYLTGNF